MAEITLSQNYQRAYSFQKPNLANIRSGSCGYFSNRSPPKTRIQLGLYLYKSIMIKAKIKQVLASQSITKITNNLLPHTLVVLMYHDICEDDDNFTSWLRVKESSFKLQMLQLREIGNFVRPSDLYKNAILSKGCLNFLITFDDGFHNQYELGLPVLEKFDIPALFFISTENVESGDLFWFDRIITPIQTQRINSLELGHLGLRKYEFLASEGAKRWIDIDALLEDIKVRGDSRHLDIKEILEYFDNNFGGVVRNVIQKCRPLTCDEISKMKASKLCYFGSHSHRHEILTYLNDNDIRTNLVKSKEYLERLSGQCITHFAYPNGKMDTRVAALCQASGYDYGFTTTSGLARNNTDRMHIPRISVSGYDSIGMLFWKINRELIKEAIRWR